MKTLIFGTSYVSGQKARYTYSLWADLVWRLNPGHDIWVIDSASPDIDVKPGINRLDFVENIGHLQSNGKEGWGRAFCRGVDLAVEAGYDYVVHIECDVLFNRPVDETIRKMAANGVKIIEAPLIDSMAMPTCSAV